MSFSCRVAGYGHSLPERILTNEELSKLVDTSDDWIVERTGIRSRHIAGDADSSSSLGAAAAMNALRVANIDPSEIDLVIAATCTPDGMFPSTASRIQHQIGAECGAFDINAACNGFITAFSSAAQFIHAKTANKVLVVGTEVLSRIVDWSDRGTCILFGDGAGAVVLEAGSDDGPGKVFPPFLGSDGGAGNLLYAWGPCASPSEGIAEDAKIIMDGPAVFKYAVGAMADAVESALKNADKSPSDITICVPHQANERIIRALMERLGLPMEKAFTNVQSYGNTSSASIPIALSEANSDGRIKPGDLVLFVAFGGGLNWGAVLTEWG